ncbi:MAG: tetratricopeptide repeat protein [Verrucomicrobiales bacterium]
MKTLNSIFCFGFVLSLSGLRSEGVEGKNLKEQIPVAGAPLLSDAAAKFEAARALLPKELKRGNPEESFALMKEAADAGYPDAVGAIGHYLANGIGTPKDEAEAVRWFRKGAELGSAKAMLNYGLMLCQGKGIAANAADGREWIRKAAATGLPEANLEWAEALFHGNHGATVDRAAAFPFYKVAADAGIPGACNTLGTMYESGIGVQAEDAEAIRLFHKAALLGHTLGQMNYGRMLDPESNDQNKRVEAIAWLLLAEQSGSVPAEKLLSPLRIGGATGDFPAAARRAENLQTEIQRSKAGEL